MAKNAILIFLSISYNICHDIDLPLVVKDVVSTRLLDLENECKTKLFVHN